MQENLLPLLNLFEIFSFFGQELNIVQYCYRLSSHQLKPLYTDFIFKNLGAFAKTFQTKFFS